jgi:class 3 adenylate cyclase
MPVTCVACGYANREGARFCAGCGAELSVICASCGASLAEGARFCDACGAEVAASRAPSESRKVLTVVFADLVGSTALQEKLDSESARQVMSRFYEAMRVVLEAEGGSLEKFIGDAVVAVFGLPALREDDALRAVRAAGAMTEALEKLNDELEGIWGVRLQMRTGVNTGELVVSDAGVPAP